MSVHSKIVTFFRKKIAQSGQILDDDVIYLNSEDWNEKKEKTSTFMWLIVGSVITGIYSIFQNKMEMFYASAIVTVVPVMIPYFVGFYYDCRSRMLKRVLENLLEEFRTLSRRNSERLDFLNSYKKYLESSDKTFITLSNDVVLELFAKASELQCSIMNLMLEVSSELHVGLKDYIFDWNEYVDALSQELKFDTIERCFKNTNILDARILLIRSHFWISVYLLCTEKGDPEILVQVMQGKIPDLLSLIRKSNSQMKDLLDKIRFFEKKCLVHPSFKHLPHLGPTSSISRMRRDVITLNNNICCTLLNVKELSMMTDIDNLDELLDELSEALSKATQNIYECFESATDLKKSIEVLYRQKNNILKVTGEDSQNETVTIVNKEIENEIVEVQEIDDVQDQEFEAFTTEDPQQGLVFADNETTADAKRIIEQQSGMIRELRKHVKFLEKKQNLDARLMASTPAVPESDTSHVPKEIRPSSIHTSPSSIKVDDETDHSSEEMLAGAQFYSKDKEERIRMAEQRISEDSNERVRMEMVQQMRAGLGVRRDLEVISRDFRERGCLASNISNLMSERCGGDGLHNMMRKFRKREEDTFE